MLRSLVGSEMCIRDRSDNPKSYVVAHTSFTYLLDAEGRWRMMYSFGTPIDIIARDVQAMLAGS